MKKCPDIIKIKENYEGDFTNIIYRHVESGFNYKDIKKKRLIDARLINFNNFGIKLTKYEKYK